MSVALQNLSFEDYLTYANGTETRYELVDGELVPMSLGTGQHGAIIHFLSCQFESAIAAAGRSWVALPGLAGVRSPRGRNWDTSRIPDVLVLPRSQWEGMAQREAIVDLHEPPPLLVVEVVSASTQTTDYRSKRSEYGLLEIPEYWIVDPLGEKILLCTLAHQFYDCTEYRGDEPELEPLRSPTFPQLQLTAAQILAGML